MAIGMGAKLKKRRRPSSRATELRAMEPTAGQRGVAAWRRVLAAVMIACRERIPAPFSTIYGHARVGGAVSARACVHGDAILMPLLCHI